MPRLIDADALMSAVMAQDVVDKSVAKRLILQAPTVDAVPVVRCGECYWSKEKHLLHGYIWLECGRNGIAHRKEWFCADGERKEE